MDLRWSRSIHSCDLCTLRLGAGASTLCSAVHYGLCTPVKPGFCPAAAVVSPSNGMDKNKATTPAVLKVRNATRVVVISGVVISE